MNCYADLGGPMNCYEDIGSSVLARYGVLRHVAQANQPPAGLPCCSFVAMWVLTVAGELPDSVWDGRTDMQPWRALDPTWWDWVNLARHDWRPWDALRAAEAKLGGELRMMQTMADAPPSFGLGRWHVCQDWRPDLTSGHTFLVRASAMPGDMNRVVQSSRRYGYRDTRTLDLPLPHPRGRLLGVLTLPPLRSALPPEE